MAEEEGSIHFTLFTLTNLNTILLDFLSTRLNIHARLRFIFFFFPSPYIYIHSRSFLIFEE